MDRRLGFLRQAHSVWCWSSLPACVSFLPCLPWSPRAESRGDLVPGAQRLGHFPQTAFTACSQKPLHFHKKRERGAKGRVLSPTGLTYKGELAIRLGMLPVTHGHTSSRRDEGPADTLTLRCKLLWQPTGRIVSCLDPNHSGQRQLSSPAVSSKA